MPPLANEAGLTDDRVELERFSSGGITSMSGWGLLFWLAGVIAVFSIPLVVFALLMRLVGRMATRTLLFILAADLVLWAMAAYFWWAVAGE
jgi:hypothetical protein